MCPGSTGTTACPDCLSRARAVLPVVKTAQRDAWADAQATTWADAQDASSDLADLDACDTATNPYDPEES